ncbi:MAG: hypothetical protein ACPG4K_11080, partial [Haloferula sp.]
MKNEQDPIEKDPVWDLLRQAPRQEASPRFVDDVVRAARLAGQPQPWWKHFALPLSLGGLTAATAAVAIAFLVNQQPDAPAGPEIVVNPPVQTDESLEVLEELLVAEALLVAAENPSEFTDAELVSLIRAGAVRPMVSQTYPLREIARAQSDFTS